MKKLFTQIRILTVFFIIVLVLSGLTAFPIYSELKWIIESELFPGDSVIQQWLLKVWKGVKHAHEEYPFIFYGFDWLAFAHLVIAILFIGVYQHPVRNRWIIQWAMITCIGILPLAFIAGTIRGIPLLHILIDCSFGVIGLIPLYIIQTKINKLKKYRAKQTRAIET
ncbi:MAG TPA: hypothetical protein VFW07_23260 [Parafilimonas sp.]|nr:hypothetical protein [Parafilimonas sp.]